MKNKKDLYLCKVWTKQYLCQLDRVCQEQFQFGFRTKLSDRQKREARAVRERHPNIAESETRKISTRFTLQNFLGKKKRRQKLHQKVVEVGKSILVGFKISVFSNQIFALVFENNVCR